MPIERDAAVDELAELRRRAYGPQADIASDPVAQSRLHDLEAAERAARSFQEREAPLPPAATTPRPQTDAAADAVRPPADAAESTGARVSPLADSGASGPVGADHAPESAGSLPTSPGGRSRPAARVLRWVRARLPWLVAIAAGVIAIAAVSALVVGEFAQPTAELTFSVRSVPMNVAKPDMTAADRDLRGIPSGALDYRGSLGKLDVWTIPGRGVNCLVFSSEGQVYWSECAHSPLQPWSEFYTEGSLVPTYSLDPEIPNGSFVRFVWEGDDVKVYVVRASSQTPAAHDPSGPPSPYHTF